MSRRALPYAVFDVPGDPLAAPFVDLDGPLAAPCDAAAVVPFRSGEFAWLWCCSGHQRSTPIAPWAVPLRPMWSAQEWKKCFDVRSSPFPFLRHVSRPRGALSNSVGRIASQQLSGTFRYFTGGHVDLDQTNAEDLSVGPRPRRGRLCANWLTAPSQGSGLAKAVERAKSP